MGSNMTGFDVLEPTVYAQFVPAGGNIATALSAMDGTGGKLVLGLGTHTATDATLTGPTDVHIMGCGMATILDISAVTQINALVVGTRGKLSDLKIVGDISPLSETWKQAISMGDDSMADDVWLDQLASGLTCDGVSNVNITRVKCTNIQADGMPDTVAPAAIHIAHASHIFVRGFYIDSCSRGVEIEDDSDDVNVEHGFITTTKITAEGGAASFTIDVHTHADGTPLAGPCTNIHYRDISVIDSGGITCYAADAVNYIYNCTFENIVIDNPYLVDGSYEAIAINQATHCQFHNIRVINIADTQALGIYNSADIDLVNIEMVNGAQSNVGVGSSKRVRLNGRFTNTTSSGYTLSVSGAGTLVDFDGVEIVDYQGSGGMYLADTLVSPKVRNCVFTGHASTPGTHGLVVQGITGFSVLDNDFDVAAGTNSINLNAALSGLVRGNKCGAKQILVSVGSDNNAIENNTLSGGATVADSGAGNIIRANPGYITENKGTATVANGQTSVAVTHGLGFTPALTQIQVTPTLMSNAAKFWITTPTSTQFTVNVDADPGAGTATFVWRASHS